MLYDICLFECIFLDVWLVIGDLSVIILEGLGDICLISGEWGLILGDTGLIILGDTGLIMLDDCPLTLTKWGLIIEGEIGFCMNLDWLCILDCCCWWFIIVVCCCFIRFYLMRELWFYLMRELWFYLMREWFSFIRLRLFVLELRLFVLVLRLFVLVLNCFLSN